MQGFIRGSMHANLGGGPRSLRLLLEGESLLNDASSITLFTIFLSEVEDARKGIHQSGGAVLGSILSRTIWLALGACLRLMWAQTWLPQIWLLLYCDFVGISTFMSRPFCQSQLFFWKATRLSMCMPCSIMPEAEPMKSSISSIGPFLASSSVVLHVTLLSYSCSMKGNRTTGIIR